MARLALLTLTIFLFAAPAALAAAGEDQGEGLWGETSDKVVTNAGFILIAFFPLLIFFASMIQWRLDVRKERRKAAAKARASRDRGGW
jgi:hypothetical protein